ncbi:hypothetical protein LZG00_13350 [Rhodobacteraceae bacterium LMO-12]|nr:hypothetical protein [Rhodobacteraceae bacterium LMO-JJ12]
MSERTEILTQATAPAYAQEGSYVDWSSILAGGVVASAIAFVFTTFGAALGLTLVSPYAGEGSAMAALIAVGSWMLWTTISSFMAGGYIAGRMRRRIETANADEVGVRDGIHGLAVWGVAILLGAFLLGASADTAVQATTETATAVASTIDGATTDTAQTTAEADVSEAEAQAMAETARKYSVISAFVLAASLMIAGAGAYWAAGMGGQHRDEGRAFARFGRWT